MTPVKISHDITIGSGRLTLIGGPCTAESKGLCLEVAGFLKELCAELDIDYIFKASYDKANRSGATSVRGPGLDTGLGYLDAVKSTYKLPVLTDIHDSVTVPEVADVADVLQVPAFLCRQTDLLVAAGKTMKPVNIKKGQFMAPEDMAGVVAKLKESNCSGIMLCDRGTSFGYHNLVVDFRGLQTMREMGVPVVFDATHSVQLPGGNGTTSGGQRQFIPALSRAAAAVGIDAVFMEVHPDPDHAMSDGPNSLTPEVAAELLAKMKVIHDIA